MATPQKPKEKETDWLKKLAEVRKELSLPNYWGVLAENCDTWAGEVSAGRFWMGVNSNLTRLRTEYLSLTGADLSDSRLFINFVGKSKSSIQDKLVQRCKLAPDRLEELIAKDGPPIPKIKDLVRTRIKCKYIDGVEYLADRMVDLADEYDCLLERTRQGSIEGYFAQHIIVKQSVIWRLGGTKMIADICCEIQIATEMATQMWDVSHSLYESVRRRGDKPEKWQWTPSSPQFISNQLGHMIHLADGLLVQLRGQVKARNK